MEHSTLTLDISSDEESSRREKEDKGKENMAPADYEAPVTRARTAANSTPVVAAAAKPKSQQTRRKVIKPDTMDDGERSPLSDLEPEDFFATGLTKDSFVMVDALPEGTASDKKELFKAIEAAITAAPASKAVSKSPLSNSKALFDVPIVTAEGDVAGDIIVWDDKCDADNQSPVSAKGEKRKRVMVDEAAEVENAVPGTSKTC